MKRNQEKTAVFIDLANSEDLDLKFILTQAREEGLLEEARCYGDFRQQHLEGLALDFYAMGLTMVHCPSWANGNGKMKRSDDRLLEKDIRDTLSRRQSISKYFLVTSDADIIPTALAILEHNKNLVLYSFNDEALGRMLRSCGFDIRQAPKRTGETNQRPSSQEHTTGRANTTDDHRSNDGDLARNDTIVKTDIVKEIDRLEHTSRYLTFMHTVGLIANGNGAMKDKIKQQLSCFVDQGVLERYEHPVPAIRLNRKHPLVAMALNGRGDAKANEQQCSPDAVAREQNEPVTKRQNPLIAMIRKEVMPM